jgi:hypothetical protein
MTPRISHLWLPAAALASLAGAALACPPGNQKKDSSASQLDVAPDSIRSNSVRTDSPRSSGSSDRLKSAQNKFRTMVLEQFDANHNGRLDSKERQAANRALSGKGGSAAIDALQKEALAQFDTNHNGKLDKTEIHKALNSVNAPKTAPVVAKNSSPPTRTATAQLQQQLLYNGVNTTSSQIQTLENLLASNSGTLSSSEVALIQSLLSQLLTQNSTSSIGTGFLPASVTTTTPSTTTTGSSSTTGSGMCSGSSSSSSTGSSSSGTSSGSTTSATRTANNQNSSGEFLSSAGGPGAGGGGGFGGSGGGFRGGFRGR